MKGNNGKGNIPERDLWPTDNETIVKCDKCRSEWLNNKYGG